MSNYHAFLIRLWRETDGQPWHAELQFPATNERHNFATPELLYNFLNELMVNTAEASGSTPERVRDNLA